MVQELCKGFLLLPFIKFFRGGVHIMFSMNDAELEQMIQMLQKQQQMTPKQRELEGLKSLGIFTGACAITAAAVYSIEKLYKKLK